MSGRKQHFIPQALLRGFAAAGGSTKLPKVWVFAASKAPFPAGTDGVAAQRHFYSKPQGDGSETLDDVITRYESRLAVLLRQLEASPSGQAVDVEIAKECVGHLVLRNAHLRASFEHAFKAVVEGAITLLTDEENARRLLGLDGPTPGDVFRAAFNARDKAIVGAQLPQGLPLDLIEYVAFVYAKENFSGAFERLAPLMREGIGGLFAALSNTVGDGHNKLMSKLLFPRALMDNLPFDSWSVLDSDMALILPDCVSIAVDAEGVASPMLLGNQRPAVGVAMPLSARRLLVGGEGIPVDQFNGLAASCSHRFFISSELNDDLKELHGRIGENALTAVSRLASEALASAKAERFEEYSPELGAEFSPRELIAPAMSGLSNFDLCVRDFGDENFRTRLATALRAFVSEVNDVWPLHRLDGMTFAEDYEAALLELDRGFVATRPLTTIDPAFGRGIGRWPPVLRNGNVKVRLVMRAELAVWLLSEEVDQRADAEMFLLQGLSHVAYVELIEQISPGTLLGRFDRQVTGARYDACNSAFEAYFSSRHSIFAQPRMVGRLIELLETAAEEGAKQMRATFEAHWRQPDFGALFDAGFEHGTRLLDLLAKVHGSLDGLGQSDDENHELVAFLEKRDLRRWSRTLREDLRRLWDTFDSWSGSAELLRLSHHVDRSMWAYSVLPWHDADGNPFIFAPSPQGQS